MRKHTILFLAANPGETDRLALDREAHDVQVELERCGHRDRFDFVTRWAAEPLDLLRELRKLKPTVVHFSGHGGRRVTTEPSAGAAPRRDVIGEIDRRGRDETYALFFQGSDGRAQPVSSQAITETFGAAGSSVKLVVLNACYSKAHAEALRAHVDCVVGMEASIEDDAARQFAIGFYGGLGDGASVAAAYKQGCAAMSLAGNQGGSRMTLSIVGSDQFVLATEDSDPGIRLFFKHLIDSHTQSFAGRESEIRQILDFIEKVRTGYVFLEGLSGYGKTSVLAELVRRNPNFVYHFISQAYKSNGAEFDPTQLEALLANVGEQLGIVADRANPHSLRVEFQRWLAAPIIDPTVLIIDAVDEIDRHPNYLKGLLPRKLPEGLVIVLSARTQGDRYYLLEVGLDRRDVALSLKLSGMGPDAITLLLKRVGGRALHMAGQPGFVAQLHRVSEGDPFYLRFLVEDIATGILTTANIGHTPTGLEGYLDQQLSQLNRQAHRSLHRDIIGLVVEEDSSLSRADLVNMIPDLDKLNFDDVIRDIHRFLLVHQDRYTFCHRRFKEYIRSRAA